VGREKKEGEERDDDEKDSGEVRVAKGDRLHTISTAMAGNQKN
jgi:hypothetical protein